MIKRLFEYAFFQLDTKKERIQMVLMQAGCQLILMFSGFYDVWFMAIPSFILSVSLYYIVVAIGRYIVRKEKRRSEQNRQLYMNVDNLDI